MTPSTFIDRRSLLAALAVGAAPAVARAQAAPTAFRSDRIVVERRGRGPDVVLIPGLASTATVWARTTQALQADHTVHLISVRGFGDIGVGANGQGAVSRPLAAEIARYIAERQLDRPALIGHSMGGQLGLRIAADRPGLVGRLMMVDASPFFPALISPSTTPAEVEPIAQVIYQTVQFLGDDVLADGGRRMGLEMGGAADAVLGTVGWQGGDRRLLAQALYEVMTVDLRPRLARVTAPVTVVYGWSPDDRSPRSRADALFRSAFSGLARPARFERIEGAEHMVMIDRPAQFMRAVERFLG